MRVFPAGTCFGLLLGFWGGVLALVQPLCVVFGVIGESSLALYAFVVFSPSFLVLLARACDQ